MIEPPKQKRPWNDLEPEERARRIEISANLAARDERERKEISDRNGRQGKQMIENKFPYCNLHGIHIVRGFPPLCPMAKPDTAQALVVMHDRACRLGHDHPAFRAAMHAHDICRECVCSGFQRKDGFDVSYIRQAVEAERAKGAKP